MTSKPNIALEKLKSLAFFDPETGAFKRLVRRGKFAEGTLIGDVAADGYWRVMIDNKRYLAHRLAWFYTHGVWPEHTIDHINGIRTDNRICNLRDVPHEINILNRHAPTNASSGVRGAYWHKRMEKYSSSIGHGGKHIFLGYFNNPEDANLAYMKAKKLLHTSS